MFLFFGEKLKFYAISRSNSHITIRMIHTYLFPICQRTYVVIFILITLQSYDFILKVPNILVTFFVKKYKFL